MAYKYSGRLATPFPEPSAIHQYYRISSIPRKGISLFASFSFHFDIPTLGWSRAEKLASTPTSFPVLSSTYSRTLHANQQLTGFILRIQNAPPHWDGNSGSEESGWFSIKHASPKLKLYTTGRSLWVNFWARNFLGLFWLEVLFSTLLNFEWEK